MSPFLKVPRRENYKDISDFFFKATKSFINLTLDCPLFKRHLLNNQQNSEPLHINVKKRYVKPDPQKSKGVYFESKCWMKSSSSYSAQTKTLELAFITGFLLDTYGDLQIPEGNQ